MTASQMMLFGGGAAAPAFPGLALSFYKSNATLFGGIAATSGTSGTEIWTSGWDFTTFGIFIAKFTAAGAISWQRYLTRSSSPAPSDSGTNRLTGCSRNLVVDSSGNAYVVGWIDNTVSRDGLLAKYNTSGTLQWQRKITGNNAVFENIAIDSTGANVAIVCNASISSAAGALVMKYNSSGVLQWQRQLTVPSFNNVDPFGVDFDSSGNVYVTGRQNFGGGASKAFVAKWNSAGTIQNQVSISTGTTQWYGTGVDGSGNVYCFGTPNTKMTSGFSKTWAYNYGTGTYYPGTTRGGAANTFNTSTGVALGIGGNSGSIAYSSFNSSGSCTASNAMIAGVDSIYAPNGGFGPTNYTLIGGCNVNSNTTAVVKRGICIFKVARDFSGTSGSAITFTGSGWNSSQFTYDGNGTPTATADTGSISTSSMTEAAGTFTDAAGTYTDAAYTGTVVSTTF